MQTDSDKLRLHGLSTEAYLKAEPLLSVEQKSALAARLAAGLSARDSHRQDAEHAEAILRLIVWNAEAPVIETMAQAAARNPNMPHSLAWALANDDEPVAMPMLEASSVLSDADLVAIVEATGSFPKMTAIARRPTVGAELSRSLARRGDEDTVHVLLCNSKADIPVDALACVLDRHGQAVAIQAGMIDRNVLPPSITQRLLGLVAGALADELVLRHQAPAAAAPSPVAADDAPLGYAENLADAASDELIAEMIAEKSLNASFLVLKLCLGHFEFFCRAVAALTGLPKDAARARILESPSRLPELWAQAALLPEWLAVASTALAALIHIDRSYSKSDPQIFRRNIVSRILATLKAENRALTDAQKKFFRSL